MIILVVVWIMIEGEEESGESGEQGCAGARWKLWGEDVRKSGPVIRFRSRIGRSL